MGIAASLFETRSTLANPSRWLERWILGGKPDTYTGVDVNHENALTYSAWAGGVQLISETMGSLPRHLRRRISVNGRDGSEVVRDQPLSEILGVQANPEMSAMDFWAMAESHLLSDGNFYAQRIQDGAGRLRELWPLEPSRMEVRRVGRGRQYLYRRADGTEVAFRDTDLLHVKMLSRDGIKGIAPLELARQAVAIGLGVEEYAGRFFSNSASVRGVLQMDGDLGDVAFARLKKDWNEIYQGQRNAHKVAILEHGLKFQQIGISPKDSQMLDLRKFQVNEVARIIRVPPHLLQDLDRATFNNIEELGIGFVKYSLVHRCVRLEQAIAQQLLSPEDRRSGLFVKHNLKGLLRGDTQRQAEFYKIGIEGGWLSPNDIRDLEDLNAIEGGDLYTQQLQRAPLSVIAEAQPTSQQPAQRSAPEKRASDGAERLRLRKVFSPLIRDAAERLVRTDTGLVLKQGVKVLRERAEGEFLVWLDQYYNRLVDEAAKRMESPLVSYGELVAQAATAEVSADFESDGSRDISQSLVTGFATRYAAASAAQLRSVVRTATEQGEDPADAVEARLNEWREKRAEKIERHEAVAFESILSRSLFLALGVSALRWQTVGKNCPLCNRMDGRIVRGAQPFMGANETLHADGVAPLTTRTQILTAPLHGGCDCIVVPA